jgi:hypothetical protein
MIITGVWRALLTGPHPPGSSRLCRLRGFHHWFTSRCTVLPCLPDPGRLAVPTRPVVVRAAPTLPGASQAGLPSASPGLLRQPSGGSFHPPGHTAPRGARPCPHGPSQGGSAAGPLACAPAGCRPAAPRTRCCRWCWPRSPAATVAARRRQPPGAAWTRAWPDRPGLRRCGPPRTARRLKLSTLTRDQSSRPASPRWSSSTTLKRSNTPAWAHSANRRQQLVTEPQPNSATGSNAQGVEVRSMKMIAAMQARSETVRGAPPRAWEGGGGSRGWMRCHNWSGSSRSARAVMSGDHRTTSATHTHRRTRRERVGMG